MTSDYNAPLSVLTLTAPWAQLVVTATVDEDKKPPKQIESRGWAPSVQEGALIGIHSARNIAAEIRRNISDGIKFFQPYAAALIHCGYAPLDPWHKTYHDNIAEWRDQPATRILLDALGVAEPRRLELGAVLGVVELGACVRGANIVGKWKRGEISDREFRLGFYEESDGPRYGWFLKHPRELVVPVFTRGFQKLWTAPDDVALYVRKSLELTNRGN